MARRKSIFASAQGRLRIQTAGRISEQSQNFTAHSQTGETLLVDVRILRSGVAQYLSRHLRIAPAL